MKNFLICGGWVVVFLLSCQSTPPATKTPPFYSEGHLNFGAWGRTKECCTAQGSAVAVASHGEFASKAGLAISKAGGNIVDVAVATAFVLAVEHPHSMG